MRCISIVVGYVFFKQKTAYEFRISDGRSDVCSSDLPGLVIEAMETVDLHNPHTTNLRVAVEYNAVGKAAGLPAHLCLKANWSELTINNNTDICELEARFYHESANMPALPAARCYYADWDGDGSGQGVEIERAHV